MYIYSYMMIHTYVYMCISTDLLSDGVSERGNGVAQLLKIHLPYLFVTVHPQP